MSFCFLYNVVSENDSVQNSPWGGEGGLLPAQGLKDLANKCPWEQDGIAPGGPKVQSIDIYDILSKSSSEPLCSDI